MNFNKCNDCGTEFLFSRAFCPKCHSGNLASIEVTSGKVLESVHLIATPDPFPDDYSVVLFETGSGARAFCRTNAELKRGDSVSVTVDEYGPVCSPS